MNKYTKSEFTRKIAQLYQLKQIDSEAKQKLCRLLEDDSVSANEFETQLSNLTARRR